MTWPRVLAMPLALMALWATGGAVIAVVVPLDFDPLIPVLIGGAGLVALGVPTFAHARRQRRTGDRHGVALRIDSAGIYLGEPPARRDLPAADAGKVRAVVAHRSPRPVPVRIYETTVYNAPPIG